MLRARLAYILPLACAALAMTASPALAHAVLVGSAPEANAVLAQPPTNIQLLFSEPVEAALSSAQVLDAGGLPVDNGDASVDPADPTRMTLTLRPLPEGIYTVSWRVTSSVDGHVTSATFPFAVGAIAVSDLPQQTSALEPSWPPILEVVARWLTFLGAAALAGGSLFILAVWDPAVAGLAAGGREQPPRLPPWGMLSAAALAVLLAGNLLGLWSQAGQVVGSPPRIWDPALGRVLLSSRYGALWAARVAMALAVGALTVRAKAPRARLAALAASIGMLLTLSLGSHAATDVRPLLPVLNDLLHLVAVTAWVGGLTHFTVAMSAVWRMPPPRATQLAAVLIPRFSRLALLSVAGLAFSGAISGLLRVGAWSDLVDTGYGGTLLAKTLLVGVMLAFGAVHLLVVTPGMRRGARRPGGDPGLVSFFYSMIRSEVALGVLAFAAAGVLTALPPTRSAFPAGSQVYSERVDDLTVEMEVTPGRVGWNTFLVSLSSGGEPVPAAREVTIEFTPANPSVAASQAALTSLEDGRYRAEGAYLSLADRWTMRVGIRRDRMFDAIVRMRLDLNPSGGSLLWPRLTGAFLALAAAPAWWLLRPRRHPAGSNGGRPVESSASRVPWSSAGRSVGPSAVREGEPSAARALWSTAGRAAVPLAFLMLGGAVLLRPLPEPLPVNPAPPTPASVESGRALYQEHCVACHGVGGKGDGPLGLTLNPRPADLTIHTIPGVHPDGQLYVWISDGYPGSVMPAWKERLPEALRWDLVNFLRTLAPAIGTPAPRAAEPTPAPPTSEPATEVPPVDSQVLYAFEAPFPWANLPVRGRLLFLTYPTEVVPNLLPIPFLAMLDLGSGVISEAWRPPQDTWLSGMALSPDQLTLAVGYVPPPPPGPRFSGYPGLYLLPSHCMYHPCPGLEPETLVEGTETDSYFGPVWSPDGSSLYFTRVMTPLEDGVPVYSIERVSAAGGPPEPVLTHATWPRLSPDGTLLAFVAFDLLDYKNDLYFASPDGSDARPAMPPGIFISVDAPVFSPDGEFIYFSAAGPGPEASSAFRPDDPRTWLERLLGVQVAHANGMPSEWWRLALAGGDPERLTAIDASGLSGDISPDGRALAFVSSRGLGMLDLEEGRLTWIYPGATIGNALWLP